MNKKEIKKEYQKEKKTLKKTYKIERKAKKRALKTELLSVKDSYIEKAAELVRSRGKKAPINPPKRALLEEIGNAVSHGLGALFAVLALILMLWGSDSRQDYYGAIVYFIGLFVMFTMSCLYHALPYGSCVKRIFRRFDYSCIYLLIGATFAPILLSYVGGVFGIVFFLVQWAVIITGITFIGVFGPTRLKWLHTPLYIILGWCGVMFLPRMIENDLLFAFYILGGGVIYSLGLIPFTLKTKVAHFVWHFFVLAGAVVQWLGVYFYIY